MAAPMTAELLELMALGLAIALGIAVVRLMWR
jgi:hypothetical protein